MATLVIAVLGSLFLVFAGVAIAADPDTGERRRADRLGRERRRSPPPACRRCDRCARWVVDEG